MARPPKIEDDLGTFKRNNIYWIRWTENKVQKKESLHTTDKIEALTKARKFLEERREAVELQEFSAEVENYILRKGDEFTKNTARTVRYAMQAFQRFKPVRNPKEVFKDDLQRFYQWFRVQKKNDKFMSESTAQNYTTRIACFLRDVKVPFNPVKFKREAETRKTWATMDTINELIGFCGEGVDAEGSKFGVDKKELCFVLLCIFHAGMRKEEIVMARPDWFYLDGKASKIMIPNRDTVSGWTPKNKRSREIPLSSEFLLFLQNWEGWREQPFMIAPGNVGIKAGQRYRYDFRKPFETFMKEHGHPEITPHVGRHSFVTHCIQDGMEIHKLSYITGDRVPTLRKHYIHVFGSQGDLDSAFDK